MTTSTDHTICPFCLGPYKALSQHLRSHYVLNTDERKLLLNLASGRVNIRLAPCPVLGCTYRSTRLDKHLKDGHPELTRNRMLVEEQTAKRLMSIQLLGSLRASNPQVAMVSDIGIDWTDTDELQCVEELDRDITCQLPLCMREGAAGSHRRQKVAMEVDVVEEVAEAGPSHEREEQVEEVAEAGPSHKLAAQVTQQQATFKGTGRGAAMRHLVLPPSIELYLDNYKRFIEGTHPTIKQLENAVSKASRVRSFIFYLSVGKSDLADWLLMDDMPSIKKYTAQLKNEGKEITTINFYLRNILQFLGYLVDTPPHTCRLRRGQFKSIIRMVQSSLKDLGRAIVTHQL
ncbi:hypothetical protein EYF80_054430 [Liparis tanakae]|uniref:Uncharacterized protein n=1 Tax=Liparis tanakae TaxID=230148 RepID=A0A4Z2F2P7_9TELE|nr:hypothetical protein EYF80_054430 [Liparis tanakae]